MNWTQIEIRHGQTVAQATNPQTYELQLLYVIRPTAHVKALSRADVNEGYLKTILRCGDVTLHSSANVQRHDVGVWRNENFHEKMYHVLSIICSTFVPY
jgi:hypothetical protein